MSVVQLVQNLRTESELNFEKLLKLKEGGRPLPDLKIKQTCKTRTKKFIAIFAGLCMICLIGFADVK